MSSNSTPPRPYWTSTRVVLTACAGLLALVVFRAVLSAEAPMPHARAVAAPNAQPSPEARPAPEGPPDSIDKFGAALLCEGAAVAELHPDGEAHVRTSQAVMSFDMGAQTMQIRVPLPYTKAGVAHDAFVVCDLHMQDDWRRGIVTDVTITEGSPR